MNALNICNGCDINEASSESAAGYCTSCERDARTIALLVATFAEPAAGSHYIDGDGEEWIVGENGTDRPA